MVFILPLGPNVKIHPSSIAQRLEEVKKHLCGHIAYLFTVEFDLPYQPGTSAEIQAHLTKAIVHGQCKAIALDAPLAAQSLPEFGISLE